MCYIPRIDCASAKIELCLTMWHVVSNFEAVYLITWSFKFYIQKYYCELGSTTVIFINIFFYYQLVLFYCNRLYLMLNHNYLYDTINIYKNSYNSECSAVLALL